MRLTLRGVRVPPDTLIGYCTSIGDASSTVVKSVGGVRAAPPWNTLEGWRKVRRLSGLHSLYLGEILGSKATVDSPNRCLRLEWVCLYGACIASGNCPR